jgi:PBP1b-binding outer membrane lipoprotein LpoB
MRTTKIILLLLAIILLISSCKTTTQIEKPKESYLPSALSPAMSEFPLQISVDIKKLEAKINKKEWVSNEIFNYKH